MNNASGTVLDVSSTSGLRRPPPCVVVVEITLYVYIHRLIAQMLTVTTEQTFAHRLYFTLGSLSPGLVGIIVIMALSFIGV